MQKKVKKLDLKKIKSEIEFSSDFIISYPGETNDDFNETLELVKKIKFIQWEFIKPLTPIHKGLLYIYRLH